MRLIIAGFLLLIAANPVAADTAGDAGYRGCGPRNLAACQNSNQLFWGLANKSGKSPAKREFRDALSAFLRGAPKLYLGKAGFSAAQIASSALVGPGDHHDRLTNGWFLDGFTPHDAPERGAVIFDPDGKIRLVALLNVEADTATPGPTEQQMSQYRLRLYSHDSQPDAANIALLDKWARGLVATYNTPKSSLVETQLRVLEKSHWRRQP